MGRVINIKILSGIPACGKTTWSSSYIHNNSNTVRVNRDELRKMLVCGIETEGNRNIVNNAKLTLITTAIDNEKDLILDDTHCYYEHLIKLISTIRLIATTFEKEIFIEVIDFNVDIEECIERNNKRDVNVPIVALYHMRNSKKEINYNTLDINKYTLI